MSKTLERWIALYNKKVPDGFKRDTRFALLYLPEKGFCEFGDSGDMVVINQCCGELHFWKKFAELYAKQHGYRWIGAFVGRHIRPWLRLAGWSIKNIENTELGDRFFCIDKKTGQEVTASPTNDRGIYIVTLGVDLNGVSI